MPMAEVILVTQNEDIPGTSTLLYTCYSTEEADATLSDISFANLDEYNCKAYRGLLMPASEIPTKLLGCVPYIIIPFNTTDHFSDDDHNEVYFKKAPMIPEKLQSHVQEKINKEIKLVDDTGKDVTLKPTIDDVYLFFGTALQFVFKIDEQEADEEFEDRLITMQENILDKKQTIQTIPDIETEEDDNMSKKIVTVKVTPSKGDVFTLEGRLLGGCVSEEAAKIAQNNEIAKRLHTGSTKSLRTMIKYLLKVEVDNSKVASNLQTFGHFVIALEAIKAAKDTVHSEVHARHLYISPKIKRTPAYVDNDTTCSVNYDCTDGTAIEITEQVSKEVGNV